MRVYQRDDGVWVVVWGERHENKQVANTEQEALDMSDKINFTIRMQELVTALANVQDQVPDDWQLFFDRGYNSGGANPIVDGDISSTGLTAAQVESAITLYENLDKFLSGTAVSQAVYRQTVNAIRKL